MPAQTAPDGCQTVTVPGHDAHGHVHRSIKGGWTWHFADEDTRSLPLPTRREAVAVMAQVVAQRAKVKANIPADPGVKVPFADLQPGDVAMLPNVARIADDGVLRVFSRIRAVIDHVRVETDTSGATFAVISRRTATDYLDPFLVTSTWYPLGAVLVERNGTVIPAR